MMFQVQRGRTQEVGVFEEEKRGRGGTTTKGMEEGEGTLWGKGTAPKRSSNEHGGVDNKIGS